MRKERRQFVKGKESHDASRYPIGLSNPQTISRRKGCLLNESNAQSGPNCLFADLLQITQITDTISYD